MKIFLSNLKMSRWGIVTWSTLIFLYGILTVYIFPTVQDSTQAIAGYMESLPEPMKAMFGYESMDFTNMVFTVESFASLEFLAIWPLMIGMYGIFASVGIAREMEQGTLDMLIAQPVKRYRVLVEKYAVFLFSAFLIAGFSLLGILVGTEIINETVDAASIGLVLLEALLLTVSLSSVTLLAAAWFLQPRRALLAGGVFMAFSYILNFVVPVIPDSLQWLRNFSVFYYYQPNEVIQSASLNITGVTVFLSVSLVAITGSLFIFRRRDLTS